MTKSSLRAWLSRAPIPDVVKVRLPDGEIQSILIPGDHRNRWKTVESSVLATGAVAVELFDKKGTLLRAHEIDREEDDEEGSAEARAQKVRARDMKEWAAMIGVVMAEQNVAFKNGVAAASQSQESLVGLVDGLAQHFATALTNIHTIVANMATLQQQHAEETSKLRLQLAAAMSDGGEASNGTDGMIGKLIASAVVGQMAQPMAQAPPQPPPKKKEH